MIMAEKMKVYIDGKEQNVNAFELLSSLLEQKRKGISRKEIEK